jgi:hypothetical protein
MRRHASRALHPSEQARALNLLELQRASMVMYTSCGWFFDDISGLEAVQVLRYAGRTIELMDELHLAPPREQFLEILAEARSNVGKMGNGADIFLRAVESSRASHQRGVPPEMPTHQLAQGKAEELFESVAEELITKAVRLALAQASKENSEKALAWIELARRLGYDAFLARAQELIHEVVAGEVSPVSEQVQALARAVGLAPCLFDPSEEPCPSGREAMSSASALS